MTLAEEARRERQAPLRLGMTLPHLWAFVSAVLPMVPAMVLLGTIDLAYHIRAGDFMLHSHHLIRVDSFSFTAAGKAWLDQQWLAQILLAAAFRPLGWPGMAALQALLVGAVFGLEYLACREAGLVPRRAALLTLAALPVAFTTLTLRPQLMAAVLFALLLWLVSGRRAHPGRLWAVPVIVALWANLHGSFFLGPLLMGLAWLEDRWEGSTSSRDTLPVVAASAVATVINPFGLRVWTYAVGISTNPLIRNHVVEWQPPSVRRVDDLIFFLSVVGVIAILSRRGRPAPWPALLTLGVFFLIALTATRNVLWWALVVPPVMARLLAGSADQERPEDQRSALNTGIAAALALFVAAFFMVSIEGASRTVPGTHVSDAPRALTARLAGLLRPGDRMFNAQRWGSWFELAVPGHPVFIDSRIELYSAANWDDYLDVSAGRQGWDQILDRWRIEVVVANRAQQAGLIPVIGRSPAWRLIYQDKTGLIFLRSR